MRRPYGIDRHFGPWSDVGIKAGYRLQRRPDDGACRLLDADGRLLALGGLDDLASRLKALGEGERPPSDTVVLLHGLTQSRRVFGPLGEALARSDRAVLAPTYASTRAPLDDHARDIARLLVTLEGRRRLVLVGHSLGGLLIRRLLDPALRVTSRHDVRGAVFVAVPNRGSVVAERLARRPTARRLFGPALLDCRPERARRLPIPTVPFCTIETGTGGNFGFNPIMGVDNDLIVRVDEMGLEGATACYRVRALHGFVFHHPLVLRQIGAFTDRLLGTQPSKEAADAQAA